MKVDFVAEVSSNHNKDFDRCLKFIDTAAECGCTSVKFQLFRLEELFAPEILVKSEKHRKRKEWELPEDYIPKLSEYSKKAGLKFGCTPFYLDAVDFLKPYIDFYKVASYELMWLDLFEKIAETKLPLVFSDGMATAAEVERTLSFCMKKGITDITLLHCNSAYPTPVKDVNLKGINTLWSMAQKIGKDMFSVKVGLSDHSVNPGVIYRSVFTYGAEMIEFHLDIDGKGAEYSGGHCWMPEQIKKVINDINDGFLADGTGEINPSESESPDRIWRADPSDGLRPFKSKREVY